MTVWLFRSFAGMVLTFLACAICVHPATYHVAPGGRAQAVGSAGDPFGTIALASAIVQPGDICYIHAGVYRETLRPARSGTSGQPIAFACFGSDVVVVTGCDTVAGWQVHGGSIYKSAVLSPVSQVFVDGRYVNEARYPDAGDVPMDTVSWAPVITNEDKTARFPGMSKPADFWKGATVVALCGSKWVSLIGTVTASAGENVTVGNTSVHWAPGNAPVYVGDGAGFITRTLNALDSPGEWEWQNDTLYLWPPAGGNPSASQVEARVRLLGIDLHGLSYVTVSGVNCRAASASLEGATGCVLDGCTFRYVTPFFPFDNGFCRDNGIAPDTWAGKGVAVSGSANTVRNCYMAHSWGDGVSVWGRNDTLQNCIIEDCDWMAIDCAPLTVTGTGHLIKGNTLRYTSRSLLVHRQLKQGRIVNNHLHDCGLYCNDLGLTYAFMTGGSSTEIAWNLMHGNHAGGYAPGIYLDNHDTAFVVHHNVVWDCMVGITLNSSTVNNRIYNNTLWHDQRAMQFGQWDQLPPMENVTTWNNLSDKSDFAGTDLQKNLTSVDPKFANAAAGDFHLKQGSPAIDYGLPVAGITDGFAGSAPDAGAYEFNGQDWIAGATIAVPVFADSRPLAPTGLTAVSTAWSRVTLAWTDNATNESGYVVERLTPDGRFVEAGRTGAGATGFVDNGRAALSTYAYRVRAYNTFGSSVYTPVVTVTTASDGSCIRLEAELCDSSTGVTINPQDIGSCDNGDRVMFRNVSFASGFKQFRTRLAVPPEQAGRKVEVRLDSAQGTLVATLVTTQTSATAGAQGGWSIYGEETTAVSAINGMHAVYFVFVGGSGVGNFDWFQFEGGTPTGAAPQTAVAPSGKSGLLRAAWHAGAGLRVEYSVRTGDRLTIGVFAVSGLCVARMTAMRTGAWEFGRLSPGVCVVRCESGDGVQRMKARVVR